MRIGGKSGQRTWYELLITEESIQFCISSSRGRKFEIGHRV